MPINRRELLHLGVATTAALAIPTLALAGAPAESQGGVSTADAAKIIESIKSRRSVRAYTDEPVSEAELRAILECAMLAPSAANEQPWEFVVMRDKATLEKIPAVNHYAAFAAKAPLAILVCLNEKKEKIHGMGILDVAIAAENMLLAAHAMGLGGVFTGIYPEKDRIAGFQKLAGLPDTVIPIGLLVFGHPKIAGERIPDRFNADAIHQEKWQGGK